MTTNGSQPMTECSHCAEHEATCAAALAGAAALRVQAQAASDLYIENWRLGTAPMDDIMAIIDTILDNPSPAVAALERRLERAAQLEDELAAVDEALGEFHCPVLDDNDEPCGAFYKDHGVNMMRQALEGTRAGAEILKERLAPMPCGHPGSCVVSADEGTRYCAWCEEIAMLGASLGIKRDEDLGILAQAHAVLNDARLERERLLRDLSRAEALVPSAGLLRRLADDAATISDKMKGISAVMESQARADAGSARALAASIEDARREEIRDDQ